MSARDDEQAIRELVDNWLRSTERGDIDTVLSLMSDDVVFITPGREPFGKKEFASGSEASRDIKFEGTADIQEIKVSGDWAWLHNFLRMSMTSSDGKKMKLSGHVLSILRKEANGKWVLARDANFVAPEKV